MRKLADLFGSQTIFGFGVGLTLSACATVGFPYKYYGPLFESYKGKLLGPTPDKDLDAKMCAPSESDPHPCVVMFAREFFAFKSDYLDTQNKLNECERP